MPQVQMWKATDGTVFETQVEHDDYQSRIDDAERVEEYLDRRHEKKPFKSAATRTKAFRNIMDFLDDQNRDAPEEQKAAAA